MRVRDWTSWIAAQLVWAADIAGAVAPSQEPSQETPPAGLDAAAAESASSAPPRPTFTIRLPGGLAQPRSEMVRVSVPLVRGTLPRGDATHWSVAIRPLSMHGSLSAPGTDAPAAADSRADALDRAATGWHRVPAVCLEEWLRDRSVRVLQLHVPVTLLPGAEPPARTHWTWLVDLDTVRVAAVGQDGTASRPDARSWAVGDALPCVSELEDTWGRVWTATPRLMQLEEDLSTEHCQVWRIDDVHSLRLQAPSADSESAAESTDESADLPGLLGLRGTLVVTPGDAHGVLTLSLTNDRALGPIQFRSWRLVSSGLDFRFKPRFRQANLLRQPMPRPARRIAGSDVVDRTTGGFEQALLGPANLGLWLGDRTAKTFRFDVVFGGQPDAPVDDASRAALDERVARPLIAVADLEWVRHTRAFGVAGGPAPRDALAKIAPRQDLVGIRPTRPTDANASASTAETNNAAPDPGDRVPSPVTAWLRTLRHGAAWGPFGAFGDPRDAAAPGTPRNGPCALQGLLRWPHPALAAAAESMVLQQTLRPTPGVLPRRPGDTAAFRRGLDARSFSRPHGFTALDYEHASVDLLHDWWWLTGDALCRDELRRAASGLLRILDEVPYLTSRGEGWSMQALVLTARAMGGEAGRDLVTRLADRFIARVVPELGKEGQPWVLRQPGHAHAFGDDVPFDAPWQMAAFVHGCVALDDALSEALPEDHSARVELRAAILHAADVMATDGYVIGEGPKLLMSARDQTHYTMPFRYGAREHTAWMQVGAFVLAAERTDVPEDAALWLRRALHIAESVLAADVTPSDRQRAVENRWFQLLFDRALAPRSG